MPKSEQSSSMTLPSATMRLMQQFSDSMLIERGLSRNTIDAYLSDLRQFSLWLQTCNSTLEQAARGEILDFLAERLQKGASSRSSARALSTLRRFYAFLLHERIVKVTQPI